MMSSPILIYRKQPDIEEDMIQEIKLSVLVTFCNQAEYIKETLDSIFSQKVNFQYEVLIGLDGEDQTSESIIQEYIYKFPNTKLFKIDNSMLDTINIEKASINRLNLLQNAKGEYLTFLDGDDFFISPERFQKMADILDNHHECITALHDLVYYDHITKKSHPDKFLQKYEGIIDVPTYLKKSHKQFSCFMFRNIFYSTIPQDLNKKFVNDSSFICYMLKYGNIYYIPEYMFSYRINIPSIYTSRPSIIKSLYSLLCGEINNRILPQYESLVCKRYKKSLNKIVQALLFQKLNKWINTNEVKQINKLSITEDCYFLNSILNFSNLSLTKKLIFTWNTLQFFLFNKYPIKFKTPNTYYYSDRPNFGDELNLYILQRILNIFVYKTKTKKMELFAIGSILQNLLRRKKCLYFNKPIKIWGSGFIEPPTKRYLKEPLKIIAVRGLVTKEHMESILKTTLDNIVLGDPGLLSSQLLDTSKFKKKYKVGIIPHYNDINENYLEQINVSNYTIIDITQNPIYLLKKISECEVILSSAMHGLIAADSLNIPNCWIKISNKVEGNDYKFNDYYSVFKNNRAEYIDLMTQKIDDSIIEQIKESFPGESLKAEINMINKALLEASKEI